MTPGELAEALDAEAGRTGFSGVVRIERGGQVQLVRPYGLRDRAHDLAVTEDTQFGLASGTKGFTALTVLSLVVDGSLRLDDPVRPLLGDDLPLVDDAVTVELLLCHRSGIGDYVDESQELASDDYLVPVPVHTLAETSGYLAILDGFPQVSPPGERFAYNNSGFVVLALVAERAGGRPFRELVAERVGAPAGLTGTAFLRSDELPGRAAVGYLWPDAPRTNVHHLPVRGSGDGGAYSTVADISALWAALFAGRIVPPAVVEDMARPRTDQAEGTLGYGLGLWVHEGGARVELHGYDAGVSFRSVHEPGSRSTWTVVSNISEATWPIEDVLDRDIAG